MKRYIRSFLGLLFLTACAHGMDEENWLYQSPSMDVQLRTAEVPVFEAEQWDQMLPKRSCASYLYEARVSNDGQIENPKLLFADEPALFQEATENSMKHWRLKIDRPTSRIFFEVLYGRSGQSDVVFLTEDDAKTLLSSLRKLKRVFQEVSAPQALPIDRKEPRYPKEAVRKGKGGFVISSFTIQKDGTVKDPEVLVEGPKDVFRDVTMKSLAQTRYEPQTAETRGMSVFIYKTGKSIPTECIIPNMLIAQPEKVYIKELPPLATLDKS